MTAELSDWLQREKTLGQHTIEAERAARVHNGQVRMAYRLAAAEVGRLMHVTGIGWHFWDEQRWVKDTEGRATRAVLAVLRSALADTVGDPAARKEVVACEKASAIAGILTIAASLPAFATDVSKLDADPYVINTPSGTLDLRNDELRPHDPSDRITKITRGAYRQELTSPGWDGFLDRVLPDDQVRGFLQRVAGLGLLGVVLEHVLPILTGTGANGKGTFDRAFGHALGSYAITAEPDLLMPRAGAHPTGQMDLLGVRWCVVSESDEGRKLAEATMKRLTGGDTIRARAMRQDFIEFEPSHTAVLITNHLPMVSGDDPAVWRRLRVVPFDVVIPEDERDTSLDARLQLDADAILTWAVEGYREYVRRGGLGAPRAVLARTEAYRVDNDAVSRFVAEVCDLNAHVSAETSTLHAAFERWARPEGVDPMSARALGQALDRLGYPASKGTGGRRLRRGIAPHVESWDQA